MVLKHCCNNRAVLPWSVDNLSQSGQHQGLIGSYNTARHDRERSHDPACPIHPRSYVVCWVFISCFNWEWSVGNPRLFQVLDVKRFMHSSSLQVHRCILGINPPWMGKFGLHVFVSSLGLKNTLFWIYVFFNTVWHSFFWTYCCFSRQFRQYKQRLFLPSNTQLILMDRYVVQPDYLSQLLERKNTFVIVNPELYDPRYSLWISKNLLLLGADERIKCADTLNLVEDNRRCCKTSVYGRGFCFSDVISILSLNQELHSGEIPQSTDTIHHWNP